MKAEGCREMGVHLVSQFNISKKNLCLCSIGPAAPNLAMLCLSCLCSPAFPDFQLVRTPGLGAALLSDELCSFRLKKNPDNKHKKNPHQPVPCIYIQLCYSWNLGYPHSPGEYLPPISWQSSMARGSSLAKTYFRGLHFKDCFFFLMQHIFNLDP